MIYITIPEGWHFTTRKVGEEDKDVLVDDLNEDNESVKVINLQEIVRTSLHHKSRKETSKTIRDAETHDCAITIYFRKPPDTSDLFLRYEPNRNGKLPADKTSDKKPMLVKGSSTHTHMANPGYGRLWWQNPDNQARLSAKRLAKVEEKSMEQKEDRRHTGDSPKAT
ncbi:hypothetical protein [Legionella spiritensis]|uniref:Permease n=1 Tax=Legionella spiritensis TaxID=452 RepID=A0A0W0ZAR5_LEGSP|nr:hypothetical protein [Legionella spiritensis]KTD66242.1 Permease [Legionella spiritensis]SNV48294.1 Permease [Legionella spiritensis]VEG91453.1 Permease [Legionella spiritensis]